MTPLSVIFGTGPVGLAIMDELLAQGQTVRMVNRSGKAKLPAGVELVSGDATDTAFTHKAAQGASVIYFALNAPYEKWPEQFPPLQAGVLSAAIHTGAKLVVMENLYGYGHTHGKPMTEDMPLQADYPKAVARIQMTQQLLQAHQEGKVQVAIARASDFFGPRVLGSALGELVMYPALKGGTIQLIGRLDKPHTYTYMPDIGKALVILAQNPQSFGKVWHIPSPQTLTTGDMIQRILAETGTQAKVQNVSGLMFKVVSLFMPMLREFKHTLYQFEEPFIMDSSRFTATFGLQATPLDVALKETVAWFRANPHTA